MHFATVLTPPPPPPPTHSTVVRSSVFSFSDVLRHSLALPDALDTVLCVVVLAFVALLSWYFSRVFLPLYWVFPLVFSRVDVGHILPNSPVVFCLAPSSWLYSVFILPMLQFVVACIPIYCLYCLCCSLLWRAQQALLPMLQFVVACTAGLIAIMLCTGCCACKGACYGSNIHAQV